MKQKWFRKILVIILSGAMMYTPMTATAFVENGGKVESNSNIVVEDTQEEKSNDFELNRQVISANDEEDSLNINGLDILTKDVTEEAVDDKEISKSSVLLEPKCVNGIYQISSSEELIWFSELVNGTLTDGTAQNTDANAALISDIDINWSGTIGSADNPYNGTFDGNNHIISTASHTTLFGYTNGTIKNFTLKKTNNHQISYCEPFIGGICNYNSGNLENLKYSGNIIFKPNFSIGQSSLTIGGICNTNVGNIVGCYNYAKIEMKEYLEMTGRSTCYCYLGGICGINEGNIDGCYNKNEITAYIYAFYDSWGYAGGIAGYNKGKILNSGNTKNVYIQSNHSHSNYTPISRAGGICGCNSGPIQKCYNTGRISASAGEVYIGGICGYVASSEDILVSDCYNKGNLYQYRYSSAYVTGGICGFTSISKGKTISIENCYNIGIGFDNESTSLLDGGICGGCYYNVDSSSFVIKNCYYLQETAGDAVPNDHATYTDVSAKEMYAFSDGSICTLLNEKSNVWMQDMGKDLCPLLITCKEDEDTSVYAFTLESIATVTVGNTTPIWGKLTLDENTETSYEILKSEFDTIQWASSDQDIVADNDITCSGPDVKDTYSSDFFLMITPKKEGTVTITGITSNGLTASCVVTAGGCIAIDQKANDLEGCTIALSGTLTLEESTEASEANLQAAINSLRFKSSDDSKAKVLACDAVQNQNHRSATLEIWTTLYNKGTATITVTAADGHTSKCEITIAEDTSENNMSYEGDYSSEMRDFLLNKGTLNTLKYLCNDSNFTASTFVAEKDATFGNLLVMSLTDVYYRGWDGWKDLIDGSTSVEEAEKIIASLLGAYQGKVEGLSKAKTAQKYAKMVNNAFSDYTKATNLFTSLNSSEIEAARKYFSEDNIAKLLYEGKYDELTAPVNQILQQGTETTEAWNELMEGFTQSAEMSKILKKGCQAKLGKLEVGGGLSDIGDALKLVSFAQDTLNYLYQLESLLTADEMYCEMLLYIQENCVYSVVQEAAGNLYSVINDGVAGIITDVSLKAINLGGEKILDVALDTACKSSLPFTIIKAGFDWGVTLSNTFFKTGSTQELKDSLRSQAFLANCLGRWVISNEMEYLSSIDTDMEAGKGKELYYSLYMLWESRKNAEETLQSFLKTTGANWSANYSVSTKVTSALESFQENIFTKENMGGLLGISVSCPVDVEVYNEGGTKLLTVKDGTECQGYEKGIYYYCIYNPFSDDYDKYIYYNEDANYNVEIIGNDLGIVDCSVSSVTNEGTISEFYFENMKINNGTVINLDGISREGVDYKVTNLNGGETSNSMDRRMVDKISTASISLNTDLLELEVGEKRLLTVFFAPANATNQKVIWDSSNADVASVNNDGVITAIKTGTAVVAVSQGDLEQTCKITVTEQHTQYKISYDLDGGNVTGNPTNYTADTLPIMLKNPIRDGYVFIGWTGSNGNTPQKTVTIAKGSTGNKSYTANWSKNQSTKTSIKSAKISLKKTSYVYNGKKKQPSVTVKVGSKKLKKGTDYKVTYKNNQKVGTASVIISGTGKYTGKVTKKFKIVPKGTSVSKVIAKSKGVTVSWKKQAKSTDGYQLQYSTSRKFTKKTTVTKTVKKSSKTKLDVKKCKAKKKYYIRIRTYKTVKGKKYYSGWSKVKVITTKR